MSEGVYEWITGHTELLGLLAHPVRHSQTPWMHNPALSKSRLNYTYPFRCGRKQRPGGYRRLPRLQGAGLERLCAEQERSDLVPGQHRPHHRPRRGLQHRRQRRWRADRLQRRRQRLGRRAEGQRVRYQGRDKPRGQCRRCIQGDGRSGGPGRRREDLHVQPQGPLLRVGVDHGRRDQRIYRRRQDVERLGGPERIQSRGDGVATPGQCHGVGTKPLEGISPLPDTLVLRDDLFVSGMVYASMQSRFL